MTQFRVNRISAATGAGKWRESAKSSPETPPEIEEKPGRYPVPAVISPAPQRRNIPFTARAAAPFLAQLSLQYDALSAVRRTRRERLSHAVRAYGDTRPRLQNHAETQRTAAWA